MSEAGSLASSGPSDQGGAEDDADVSFCSAATTGRGSGKALDVALANFDGLLPVSESTLPRHAAEPAPKYLRRQTWSRSRTIRSSSW